MRHLFLLFGLLDFCIACLYFFKKKKKAVLKTSSKAQTSRKKNDNDSEHLLNAHSANSLQKTNKPKTTLFSHLVLQMTEAIDTLMTVLVDLWKLTLREVK